MTYLDFSEALKLIKQGLCMARKNWDMRFKYIKIEFMDDERIILCKMYNGETFVWVPVLDDILSNDWYVEVNID